MQGLYLRVHDACEVVCRAGQAHPDKQHVLVGVLAAFLQPEQDGDRDAGGRPPGAAFPSPGLKGGGGEQARLTCRDDVLPIT